MSQKFPLGVPKIPRLHETGGPIQIVIAPRQVGKTTALRGAMAGAGIYFSADSPAPLPVSIITELWNQAANSVDKMLALDELQKILGWSEEVKRLWDNGPKLRKVVLTGSASLLVEKGLRESLAGRFEIIRAEHWNADEAREIFGVELRQFIEFGCYPGSMALLPDIERWASYVRDAIVEPAIGRDILQLHPVDSPALLREILGVAVALPAQIISLQKIQGQLQVKGAVATVSNYLRLLSHAFLVTGLQKYSPSAFRVRQSSPKLIVHDNGILRAFERPVTGLLTPERSFRYLENAIGARLIEAGWQVFYWRERTHEVDFVALGPGGENWAIEVKSGRPEEKDLASLKKFCSIFPQFMPCIVALEHCVIPRFTCLTAAQMLSMTGTKN